MEKSTLHLSFADQEGNGLTDPVSYYGQVHAERVDGTAGETLKLECPIRPATLLGLWISSTQDARLLAIGDDGEIVRELELAPRRPVLWYRGIGVEASALFDRDVAELRVASDHPQIVNVRLSHEADEEPGIIAGHSLETGEPVVIKEGKAYPADHPEVQPMVTATVTHAESSDTLQVGGDPATP